MTNLTEVSAWDAGVYSFLTTDPVQGGPGGIDNEPHQNLVNRVLWLRNRVAAAIIQSGQADGALDNQQLVEAVVLQVASVPALRLVPIPLVPTTQTVLVLTRGQASDGDGRAATYKWSAAATGADDGVATVSPAGTPASGRWLVCGINASALGGQNAAYYAQTAAVAAAVALLAPKLSPSLTGTPTAPTPLAGDSSATLATTQFVASGYVPKTGIALVWNNNPNTYYKLATLPASAANTADSIHIKATLNVNYAAANDTMLDGIFGNRAGFSYVYNLFGPNNPAVSIQCFTETDGTVSVYALCTYIYGFATVTVLNAGSTALGSASAVLYPAPPATLTPTGTLCFSSGSPLVYPPFLNVASPLSYLTPAVAAQTYLPLTGGFVNGQLTVYAADLHVYRPGGATAAIYLSSDATCYLYNDGTNFNVQVPNGGLLVNGQAMARQIDVSAAQAAAIASSNATTTTALARYLPLVGGTLSGAVAIAGADLTVYRSGGTTGVLFLNSAQSAYVYWNGTTYNMPGGELMVNGYQLARLVSPGFSGTPTAPTAAAGTKTTQLATTAFVAAATLLSRTGTFTSTGAAQTVTFVPAFPTACVGVVIMPLSGSGAWYFTAAPTKNGFTFVNENGTINQYLAFGN